MKFFKILVMIIKGFFICFVVVFAAFIFLQRFSNNNFSILGYRLFAVATGSMEPVYHVGDVILCKDVDYHTLKVGDDVTYLGTTGSVKDKVITHRIVHIDEYEGDLLFQTKGIASISNDPAILGSQIYGKVLRKAGLLSLFHRYASSPTGIFVCIIVPLMLLIGTEFVQSMVERKKALVDATIAKNESVQQLEEELKETQKMVQQQTLTNELALLKKQVAEKQNLAVQQETNPETVPSTVPTQESLDSSSNDDSIELL